MATPCRPGMCLLTDADERVTVTAIARHAGADDGNRFVITAGHACHAGQSLSYFPLDAPRAALGKCVASLYPRIDLASCAATLAQTWGAPYGYGWEAELFVGDVASLSGASAIFLGAKQDGAISGTIGAIAASTDAGVPDELAFTGTSAAIQTWTGDSGGPLLVRSDQGGLLLVGMLVRQPAGQPLVFQYPGPGLAALGLVLVP